MTTSRADLLAGVDMVGGEGFCDSIYNFLKNQGKDINLLTNSGFGVWSQSDANKGLATITYDAGSAGGGSVPSVGDAVVGGTSGAVCKVISYTIASGAFATNNATGVVTVGAVSSDFAFVDNETITFDGAETAVINMPDAAVQVGLVQNGGFAAATTGWAGTNCTLASIAGGEVGNCLEITRTGAASQTARQEITGLTVGKIYKYTGYIKSGTSGNEIGGIFVRDAADAVIIIFHTQTTTGSWVKISLTFEATETSVWIWFYKGTGTPGTMLFDEATFYEITPCCTVADNLACDGWYKDSTVDIYRQHWDTTYTKNGSFYSLKLVPSAANDNIIFPTNPPWGLQEFYKIFTGRPVTMGAWVYASTANHARLRIRDSVDSEYSSYHSGTPGWEWLEVTHVINSATDFLFFRLFCEATPNVDGSTIVYVSQPMLVLGWSLGEGMYQPRLQEIIWLEKNIPSNTYDNTADWGDVAATAINIEADSDAMLPKGAKLIAVHTAINDSGSGGGLDVHLKLRKDATSDYFYCNSVAGKTNDVHAHKSGVQPCDVNGDVDIDIDATGADTFDIEQFEYHGVQVN